MKFGNAHRILLAIAMCLVFLARTRAGGPLNSVAGKAVTYKLSSLPIPYVIDRGSLGPTMSEATAQNLARSSFLVWQNVPTTTINFRDAGVLSVDVDSSNYKSYIDRFDDGINPVVFDNDGSIIRKMFGANAENSILGFAGSSFGIAPRDSSYGFYVESQAVMNGKLMSFYSNLQNKSTFVHEFGHLIGLDHSQINAGFAGNGNQLDDRFIPTMFPTSTDNDTALVSLNPDDIAAVSSLYPAGSFAGSTGTITGSVTRYGGSVVRGANVIAISTTDSLWNQVSTVTDYLVRRNGSYAIPGLTPGSYWVKIEPINARFMGGSSVGPYADDSTGLSFTSSIEEEFYSIPESADPSIDDPSSRAVISVTASGVNGNIDIIANGLAPKATFMLQYFGNPAYVVSLPSEYADTRYAVRFTPEVTGTLLRTAVFLNGGANAIRGDGALKVSVHNNQTGSLGGIPGTLINGSMTIPFQNLKPMTFNQIDLSSLNVAVTQSEDFHIAFEVVGNPGDTLEFIIDDGTDSTTRSSSYFTPAHGTAGWYNFADPDNFDGGYNLVITAVISMTTAVAHDERFIPSQLTLFQNFPNPFNPSTTIRYQLSTAGHVNLTVYDMLGRMVRTLFNDEQSSGIHQIAFDASHLSSGCYYYVLATGRGRQVKPMLLLR